MCAGHVVESIVNQSHKKSAGEIGRNDRTSHIAGNSVVDLTHNLTPDFPLFPGVALMSFDVRATVEVDGWYEAVLTIAEHTGTHIDAPAHFTANGLTVDQIGIDKLVAPLVVVRIAERAETDHDTLLALDDLYDWERRNGPMPSGCLVAMDSGWCDRALTPNAFLNLDSSGTLHYPGFHPDAASFLVNEREIVGIGVDTLSLDHGPAIDFPTHHIVLPAGKYGVEALNNLGNVPESGAMVFIGCLIHSQGSGSPVRAIAIH
jgi:kynurenine formamidase